MCTAPLPHGHVQVVRSFWASHFHSDSRDKVLDCLSSGVVPNPVTRHVWMWGSVCDATVSVLGFPCDPSVRMGGEFKMDYGVTRHSMRLRPA